MKQNCPFLKKLELTFVSKADIIMVQDCRLNSNYKAISSQLNCSRFGNYDVFANSPQSNRGVAIFVNRDINFESRQIFTDDVGNYIISVGVLDDQPVVLASVYGPNNHLPAFYDNLSAILEPFSHFNQIICGDFNTVNDMSTHESNIDLWNATSFPLFNNAVALGNLMVNCNLFDSFRHLHPFKKAYSYSPFSGREYSSRIDMILLSHPLSNLLCEADIIPSCSKSLDHSSPFVKLSSKVKLSFCKNPSIDPNALSFPGIKCALKLCCLSTILMHNNDVIPDLNRLLDSATLVFNENFKSYCDYLKITANDKLLFNIILHKFYELELALDTVDIHNIFIQNNFDISADLLLQVTCNEFLNKISSLQKLIRLSKFHRFRERSLLITQSLANDDWEAANFYNNLIKKETDNNIAREIRRSQFFKILENERPSKSFCKISKSLKSSKSLEEIKKPNGSAFSNSSDRSRHIHNFYADIYKVKATNGTVESFLGDIAHSNLIKRISQLDKERLESEITIVELNEAFSSSNKKSAGGCDQMTYDLISPIFSSISGLVKNAFDLMVRNEKLSQPFSNVSIRLIPKKGNCESIQNWRPISLLSILYKLCSSVIAKRLLSVIDSITSFEQTGFSSKKRLSSTVNSLIESINLGLSSKIPGFVFCGDFRKAFDLININYVLSTFEFFGFGPFFCKLIKTILTGKKGSIIGADSESFDILSGTGQGDPASPLIFLLGIEPLLIYLKHCNRLSPISFQCPDTNSEIDLPRTSAFADDISTLGKLTEINIINLINIYKEFERVSGMILNESKSEILLFNASPNDVLMVKSLCNFQIVKKIKTLGFVIGTDINIKNENATILKGKISKTLNFWSKFHLSIYGRACVVKTYIYSLIAFYSSCLHLDSDDLKWIKSEVVKFIKLNEKLAESRIFFKVERGGLGLTPIPTFSLCLRVSSLKHEFSSTYSSFFGILAKRFMSANLATTMTDKLLSHTRHIRSFLKDKDEYIYYLSHNKDNFLKAPVFSLFNNQINDNLKLTNIGLPNNALVLSSANNMTWSDLCNNNLSLKNKNDISFRINFNISWNTYFRLRANLNFVINKLKMDTHNIPFFDCAASFRLTKKVKSNVFSKQILNLNEKDNLWVSKKLTAANLRPWDAFDPTIPLSVNFLSNPTKLLYFKFLNNTLILNGQLAKFEPTADPRCHCCAYVPWLPQNIELKSHIFYNCPALENVRIWFLKAINSIFHSEISCLNLETGIVQNFTRIDKIKLYILWFWYILFIVWYRKCRNIINPN